MRGLAVASPLHPAAAAARRRPHASSSGREAASQCWKYDLSQDRSLGGSLRICQSQGNLQRHRSTNLFRPAAAAISVEQDEINTYLPKGDMWSVHKFGGTCMGTPQRIQSVADIILGDSSERKLVIVSAMSKVTDMMYNLVHKAQSRDDSYTIALEEVFEKHMAAAKDLLDGEDLARFLSQLHSDVSNLRAMLRAIYIAGHATESFSDFVVGHGELWSAQMLFFFESKAGALPIHLRRSNCTSRAEANTTTHKQRTRTTHTTRHYTTAIWEKSQSKPSQPAPSSPTLCHIQSHNPLQAQEAT